MGIKTAIHSGFHAYADTALVKQAWQVSKWDTQFTYKFDNFFHPFVNELIERLNKRSLPGLFDPAFHEGLEKPFFDDFYEVLASETVVVESSPKDIDVRTWGPYANYNWELLFHVPLTIAVHLSKTQRFADAQRWFHFIFDPTSTDKSVAPPQRFWRFLAFRSAANPTQIDELLALLSKKNPTPAEIEVRAAILGGYEAIKNKPFQPHAVARTRQIAYQYCVVMKYLDNLIAWGDHLFRQDTIESINEATQRYVLAANLLGARPQRVPSAGGMRPRTYAQIKQAGLDAMGNVLVELEGKFPLNLDLPQTQGADPDDAGPLFGIGRALYFCIPRNDKLLGYWDTVGDRLFKIRNSMNLEGVVRQLALFEPPIDPGMLVKAAAAGVDIGSVVSGLKQPAGLVRAPLLIQKALELCAEVRGLGAGLLAAIEKGDSEQLALLRQGHEIKIQQMQQDVRFLHWQQAREATQALIRGRAAALERYRHYQRLLGLPADDNNAPETVALNRAALTEENFDEVYGAFVGQYDKALTPIAYPRLETREEGRMHLHIGEYEELNGNADRALAARISATGAEALAAALSILPGFNIKVAFWGVGAESKIPVGEFFSNAGRAISAGFNLWAQIENAAGEGASKTSSYTRRADEWMFQSNLAARELMQTGRQIIGSLIAEQVAHREYLTIQKQIEQTQSVDGFLREKFSSAELYAWMQGELSRLYYEYYRFAFDTARKAEQTLKRELLRQELDATDYIKFNYWDSGRRGLLSGEALYLDVKRMEMAYLEHNKREYELVRHVSLLQLDPMALLKLRATGRCTVSLPEELFDMDAPGHYCRRLKNVAVSIPCVTGPYGTVNCTLTLLRSRVRKSPLLGDGYEREGPEDGRFMDYFGSVQSIVTSSGQNDSGLFETNLRDDRYLPFENAGAISEWAIELPADPSRNEPQQFDYATISDVIMHVRYTAREGGTQLRQSAIARVSELISAAGAVGTTRLFSARHEFPAAWAKFRNQAPAANQRHALVLELRPEHYPFWSVGRLGSVERVDVIAQSAAVQPPARIEVADRPDKNDLATIKSTLLKDEKSLGKLLAGGLADTVLPAEPAERLQLFFDSNDLADLWIALKWGT